MDITQSSVKRIVETISGLVDAGVKDMPFFLSGACGIGKTTVGHIIADKYDLPVVEFRPAEIEAVELVGAPYLNADEKKVEFFRPEIVPTDPCVFLVDELTLAHPSVYSVLIKLIRERELGGVKLHDDTIVIATGNRVSDRAGVNRISSALRESFVMFDVVVKASEWLQYYATHEHTNSDVWNFIASNDEWLHKWDGKVETNQPNPRNWVKVGRVLDIMAGQKRKALLSGIVGKAATNALTGWIRENADRVTVRDVLDGKSAVPTHPLQVTAFRESIVEFLQIHAVDSDTAEYNSVCDMLAGLDCSEIVPALTELKKADDSVIKGNSKLSSLLIDHIDSIKAALG